MLVDVGPQFADPQVNELLVGDGFGPVIDEEHKGQCQQESSRERKRNWIMECLPELPTARVNARITLLRRFIQCARVRPFRQRSHCFVGIFGQRGSLLSTSRRVR